VPPRTGATLEARRQYADASAKAKKPNRVRSNHLLAGAIAKAKNQTARAAKPLHRTHRNSTHPNSVADKKPTLLTTLPRATGIPGRLPLPKKLLITHNRAIRMRSTHMRDISLIVGHPDHQPHGLPEISPGVDHIIPKS
jgi:hypothetical protein